jgi:hypothetical protein
VFRVIALFLSRPDLIFFDLRPSAFHSPADATIVQRAAAERAAANDFRSVNAQVEVLLREALAKRGVKVGVSEAPKRGRPVKEGS